MDEQTKKEIIDIVNKYQQLEEQKKKPTRDGMLKALQEAQWLAPVEIKTVEATQGDIYPMLWTDFSDRDLYRKLPQFQQGLVTYCVSKYGKDVFEKLLQELNGQK